jgi:hypothetical protein
VKFDQILLLCAEGFASGTEGLPNLFGDDWKSHMSEIFALASPPPR